jgi:hypothetical protein
MPGLRGMVTRTANWGSNPEIFEMMIRRYIEYLETPELQNRHNLSFTSFAMYHPLSKWEKFEKDKRYAFSEAWRLEIINTFYFMARICFIDWSAYRLNRYYRKYRKSFRSDWQKLKIGNYPYQFQREEEVQHVIQRCRDFDRKHPFVPHNHMTQPALSLFHAATSFEK